MANFFGTCDSLPERKQKHIYHSKQTLQNMSHITSILFIIPLLKTLTLILSFSLLSLLFLHPSWLRFCHLFTFSWQFLSHGADKNYIFLLCNGLLVLVAKYSYWTLKTHSLPFSSSDQTITSHEDSLTFKGYALEPSTDLAPLFGLEYAHSSIASHVSCWESDSPLDQTEPSHLAKDVAEIRDGNHEGEDELICGHHHEHDDYKEVYIEEDEEYDEEGENGKMSREELNRKIEDFIRKRKEELRIEAQQQLIVVYD